MKDPVSIFGGWRGFFVSRLAGPARKTSAPDQARRNQLRLREFVPEEVQRCPHGWKFC